jgi:hypothetical protein
VKEAIAAKGSDAPDCACIVVGLADGAGGAAGSIAFGSPALAGSVDAEAAGAGAVADDERPADLL